jgi:LmbE family N-acetylglucosaminyl deacetylase
MPSLAAVFAHPDDETFAVGGTLAKLAATGTRWDLYCATDGDAGRSSGISVASREELGALRRDELRRAARHLGAREIVCAGHRDGELAAVDFDALVGEIVAFLRRVRPDVVITFGPEGAPTGHRDHKAISRAATAAYFLSGMRTSYPDAGAAHAPRRLYYVTWPAPSPDAELQLLGLPASAKVDVRAQLDAKRRAFELHATQRQHEARFTALGMTEEEWYFLASGDAQGREVVEGLFEGLRGAASGER